MRNWSVIKTRYRWEKKVVHLLQQKGIESYCPIQKARHQWSDRVKTVEKPLLKSYVFVKVEEDQRTDVRLTEGVVNFVSRNGKPVVVKEKLIQDIRQFQELNQGVQVLNRALPINPEESPDLTSPGKTKAVMLGLDMLDITLIAQ